MNGEAYSYVVLTAAVGMGVVFFFLGFLSLLMYVIRGIFEDRPPRNGVTGKTGTQESEGSTSTGGGADVRDSHGIPRWVVAGALAYLSAEEREYAPHSGGWTQREVR